MSSRSAAPARNRRWRRPYLWVMGLFWAAPGVVLVIGYLALPDFVPNQCDGTLFGCSITPKDGMVLLAVLVYPLVAIAGLLVMSVIAMGQAWQHRWRGGLGGQTCHAESNAQGCPTRPPCRLGKCVTSFAP